MNAPKFKPFVTITVHCENENEREDAELGERVGIRLPFSKHNLEDAFEHWWAVNRAVYDNGGRRSAAYQGFMAAAEFIWASEAGAFENGSRPE